MLAIIILNAVLITGVVGVVVGLLAHSIWVSRDAVQPQPARARARTQTARRLSPVAG